MATNKDHEGSSVLTATNAAPPSMHALGMYDDPSAGVQVGDFNIRPQRPGYVWIERGTGEGGEFTVEQFEAAVRAFYAEHF